ncbi:MAG TPA: GDP-mannose 4,6-dehydratase [Bryobacteraceae bacterium]|nr:GDP-mannose 4,6-dehydratase [Bryobacteraceae bacterium]
MRHSLLTGGAGFIGSHLVDRLLADNWRVTTIDNFDPFYCRRLKERNIHLHRHHPCFRLVEADIRDREALRRELAGDSFDVLIHLAARAGVRPSILDPMAYQDVNVGGTQNLLEFAKRCGIPKIIFASSSSVYGVNPNTPWREDDPVLLPISPYAATKIAGELMGHVYSKLFGIQFLALRFFTVYGPRQRPDLAINKMSRMILNGEPIPIFGDGSTTRDYTYIDDIVAGVCTALEYEGSLYEVINLGNNQTISLLEMVRVIENALGRKARLEFQPQQPGDVPRTAANIEKARMLLGYEPSTRFSAGITQFAKWLQKHQNNFPCDCKPA